MVIDARKVLALANLHLEACVLHTQAVGHACQSYVEALYLPSACTQKHLHAKTHSCVFAQMEVGLQGTPDFLNNSCVEFCRLPLGKPNRKLVCSCSAACCRTLSTPNSFMGALLTGAGAVITASTRCTSIRCTLKTCFAGTGLAKTRQWAGMLVLIKHTTFLMIIPSQYSLSVASPSNQIVE